VIFIRADEEEIMARHTHIVTRGTYEGKRVKALSREERAYHERPGRGYSLVRLHGKGVVAIATAYLRPLKGRK
jgi:hypothetical protein